MRKLLAVFGTLAVLAASPQPAAALFHIAVIDEVMTSYGGDDAAQFVEIKMEFAGQTQTENSVLAAFGADGSFLGDVLVVPDPIENGGDGLHWLMGTTAFETAAGIQVDFEFTAGLVTQSGMICWGGGGGVVPENPPDWDREDLTNYVDCVAYGAYTGPTHAHSGTPTPLSPDGHSLRRIGHTDDNAADFACADPADPTNNDAAAGSLAATTPCPACGDNHVDPGEECDDGNTVDGDGCSANCGAGELRGQRRRPGRGVRRRQHRGRRRLHRELPVRRVARDEGPAGVHREAAWRGERRREGVERRREVVRRRAAEGRQRCGARVHRQRRRRQAREGPRQDARDGDEVVHRGEHADVPHRGRRRLELGRKQRERVRTSGSLPGRSPEGRPRRRARHESREPRRCEVPGRGDRTARARGRRLLEDVAAPPQDAAQGLEDGASADRVERGVRRRARGGARERSQARRSSRRRSARRSSKACPAFDGLFGVPCNAETTPAGLGACVYRTGVCEACLGVGTGSGLPIDCVPLGGADCLPQS